MSLVARHIVRTQPDTRLVELARLGNEEAFDALARRYRDALERYCRRLLPPELAEDAVQQTLLSAWSSLQSGCEVTEPKAWLYRIAHRASLKVLSKRGAPWEEISEAVEVCDASADMAFERRAAVRHTLRAVSNLPGRQRDALVLVASGHGHDEVADCLELSEGAVRQLVHRARQTLRSAAAALTPFPWLVRLLAPAGSATSAGGLAAGIGGVGLAGTIAKTTTVMVVAIGAAVGAGHSTNHQHGSQDQSSLSNTASSPDPSGSLGMRALPAAFVVSSDARGAQTLRADGFGAFGAPPADQKKVGTGAPSQTAVATVPQPVSTPANAEEPSAPADASSAAAPDSQPPQETVTSADAPQPASDPSPADPGPAPAVESPAATTPPPSDPPASDSPPSDATQPTPPADGSTSPISSSDTPATPPPTDPPATP